MRIAPALCLVLVLLAPARAEERLRPDGQAFVGLTPLDAFDEAQRDPVVLERMTDLGAVLARTTPIRWGALEPQPPRAGPPRYEWKALDEAVLVWQLSGLEPVLVLEPTSPWASMPAAVSAWAQTLSENLPEAEAQAALREARGSGPPRPGTWTQWERFVRDVVERYDGDGQQDMPGLRRPVRYLQVLDGLGPRRWLGSVEEYLRVLHHAGQGAHFAHAATRIVTAMVDVQATGYEPYPDRREWDFRIGQLVPSTARLARLENERGFAHLRRLLEMPRLFDVLAQRGSAHTADDVANLRFLRHALDEGEGRAKALWLVDSPTRRLGDARVPGAVAPKAEELRLRRHWLPAATNPRHPRHGEARAWLRRGQAFDLVRGVCRARAAGADAVLLLAPLDEAAGHPAGVAAAHQGLLARERGDAPGRGLDRTASWWALRQLLERVGTHVAASETSIGAPGRSVVFRLPPSAEAPWVAVLMLDPRLSWAGEPGAALPVRDVLVPLPSGRYLLETCRLGPEAPRRKTIEVREGMVSLPMTPGPLYLVPVGD